MKRKVIQIADSTQLVSLPRKWCKANNIKKGDELEVVESTDSITINATQGQKRQERVEVDVSGLGLASNSVVSALYKAGYDEFKVRYSNVDELRNVQKIVKDCCLGFEIVEHGKDYVVARKISEPIADEFEPVLKRTFFLLRDMIKEAYSAVESGDDNALNTVIAMDSNINKFTYFCRRVLIKYGRGSQKVTAPLYYIVDELEEIGDRYKHICRSRLQNKGKISKNTMQLFEIANNMVEMITSLYYKFEWKSIDELYSIKKQDFDVLAESIIQRIEKKELGIFMNLGIVADKVYELAGPVALVQYEPKTDSAALK